MWKKKIVCKRAYPLTLSLTGDFPEHATESLCSVNCSIKWKTEWHRPHTRTSITPICSRASEIDNLVNKLSSSSITYYRMKTIILQIFLIFKIIYLSLSQDSFSILQDQELFPAPWFLSLLLPTFLFLKKINKYFYKIIVVISIMLKWFDWKTLINIKFPQNNPSNLACI